MSNVVKLTGREAPKAKKSVMDTKIYTRAESEVWKVPPFQREKRVNAKVLALSKALKTNGGIMPGVITLGWIGSDKTVWLVDGQHRREAFLISDLQECIADVRMCHYVNMADMADDYVELNGKLVNMRPDDILRALEEDKPELRRIRTTCDYVTYGQINRYQTLNYVIGMSMLLRCWFMSAAEVPSRHSPKATDLAAQLTTEDTDKLIVFMQTARAAWGTDAENIRLWGTLNLTITMWLWRRLVTPNGVRGLKKAVTLTPDQFRKAILSVSADAGYLEWLVGRQLGDRDRVPCYSRLKAIFVKRLQQEGLGKVMLPQPSWVAR